MARLLRPGFSVRISDFDSKPVRVGFAVNSFFLWYSLISLELHVTEVLSNAFNTLVRNT